MVNRMRVRLSVALLLIAAMMLSSGCMYRQEMKRTNANPAVIREEIARVQAAVDQYRKERTVLPIKNSSESTPIYEKYVIDVRSLVEGQYLSSLPSNAYEKGGSYYYVLVDVETEPAVKLMNVVAYQQVNDLEAAIRAKAKDNGGRLPLGIELAPGFYTIDFESLGVSPLQIEGAFPGHFLPLIVHESGTVAVDYALDIAKAMEQAAIANAVFDQAGDLREVLVSQTNFVPIRSYPYVWKDNQPVVAESLDNQ